MKENKKYEFLKTQKVSIDSNIDGYWTMSKSIEFPEHGTALNVLTDENEAAAICKISGMKIIVSLESDSTALVSTYRLIKSSNVGDVDTSNVDTTPMVEYNKEEAVKPFEFLSVIGFAFRFWAVVFILAVLIYVLLMP